MSPKRKVSEVINDLAMIWPEWNKLNVITIDHSKPSKDRLKALRGQEYLVQKRYDLIREIDDIIDFKLSERNKE